MGFFSRTFSFLAFWRKKDESNRRVFDIRGDADLLKLVQQPAVQSELGLTTDQIESINRHIHDARNQHRQKFRAMQQLPAEKQRKAKARLRKEVSQTAIESIEKSDALTPEQKTRLQQIGWQSQGAKAFLDARLRNLLRLTSGQEESINDTLNRIGQTVRQESNQVAQGPLAGEQKKKLNSLKDEAFASVLGKLSNDQKRVWHDVIGEPFSIEAQVASEPRRA